MHIISFKQEIKQKGEYYDNKLMWHWNEYERETWFNWIWTKIKWKFSLGLSSSRIANANIFKAEMKWIKLTQNKYWTRHYDNPCYIIETIWIAYLFAYSSSFLLSISHFLFLSFTLRKEILTKNIKKF